MSESVIFRLLGLCDYETTFQAMSDFTSERLENAVDEIWSLQHPSVYTLGLAGKKEHILNSGQIPVIKTDRGGQVTYHGPGQLVIYLLLDLRRRKMGIKDFVNHLEQALIDYLKHLGLSASRKPGAPGVYIEDKKIAALGIRVRKGCCYHGLSLNVDMDVNPFNGINPCGYPNLEVTQLVDFGIKLTVDEVVDGLLKFLLSNIYTDTYNITNKHDLRDLLANHVAA
jgi:lipoyl(octanoyl) transferase